MADTLVGGAPQEAVDVMARTPEELLPKDLLDAIDMREDEHAFEVGLDISAKLPTIAVINKTSDRLVGMPEGRATLLNTPANDNLLLSQPWGLPPPLGLAPPPGLEDVIPAPKLPWDIVKSLETALTPQLQTGVSSDLAAAMESGDTQIESAPVPPSDGGLLDDSHRLRWSPGLWGFTYAPLPLASWGEDEDQVISEEEDGEEEEEETEPQPDAEWKEGFVKVFLDDRKTCGFIHVYGRTKAWDFYFCHAPGKTKIDFHWSWLELGAKVLVRECPNWNKQKAATDPNCAFAASHLRLPAESYVGMVMEYHPPSETGTMIVELATGLEEVYFDLKHVHFDAGAVGRGEAFDCDKYYKLFLAETRGRDACRFWVTAMVPCS